MAVRPPAAGSSAGKFVQLEGLPYGASEEDGHAFVQLEDQRDLRMALFKSGARVGGKSGRYIKVWTIVSQPKIEEIKARMSGAFRPPNAFGRFPVKLRGLPWEVKERDLLSFFRGLPVVEIVWGREAGVNGRFDGDAAVLFRTRNDQLAALRSHMKMFDGRRYVEVYPFDPQSYDSYKCLMTTDLHYRPRTLAEVVDDPQAIVPTVDPSEQHVEEQEKEEDLIDWNTIPDPIPAAMHAPIPDSVENPIENTFENEHFEKPPFVDFTVLRSDSPQPTASDQEEESSMPELLHKITYGRRGFNEKMELFRMRFCRTILSVQRGHDFVHYGLLQHQHEQLHGEPLKTESYRKYFPFKSQFTIDKVRERMIFELEKRTSPDGRGCIFRLRHPIDVVQRFHAELRKARQQHEEILARHAPIEDAEDSLDFGTIQPRGGRR
ncbi:G-rich sequence factor 1 isoform X4 [Aphelenchoides fujianensis]|nr:G-rich sequence factor 1 isoform X4 [Aphelenchoides fujianensis]